MSEQEAGMYDRALAQMKVQRDRLHQDLLCAMVDAGASTPEEGYLNAPHCVGADIARLARERDQALADVQRLEARNARQAEDIVALAGQLEEAREALRKYDALWGIKVESESREELQALTDAFKSGRAFLAKVPR